MSRRLKDRPAERDHEKLTDRIHALEEAQLALEQLLKVEPFPTGLIDTALDVVTNRAALVRCIQAEPARRSSLAVERRGIVSIARRRDKWASPSCVDGWLCPDGPAGVCAYDEDEDPARDTCLHCGFPDERK